MENYACIHDDVTCRKNGTLRCGASVDGPCPFRGDAASQALYCRDFKQLEPHASGEVDASWEDVKAKGEAIVASGGVTVIDETPTEIYAEVISDVVRGQTAPNGRRIRVDFGGPYMVTLAKRSWENHQNVGGWIQGYLCTCFVPETEVDMADGTKRRICDVKDGDLVMAPSGVPRTAHPMSRAYSGTLVSVCTEHRDLYCTPEHPVWAKVSPSTTMWVEAGDVRTGTLLCVTDGMSCSWERVNCTERRPYEGTVYNLSVDVDESYIANGVKVHNCTWGQYNSGEPGPRWRGRFCVPPDTKVALSDGTEIPIESVRPGESVESLDGPSYVEQTMSRPYHGNVLKLRLDGIARPLTLTPNHPVLTVVSDGSKQFVEASEIKAGSPVYVLSGGRRERCAVVGVKEARYNGRVYNLKVRGSESYFANGVCVHNCSHALAALIVTHQRARKDFTRSHMASRKRAGNMNEEDLFNKLAEAMFGDDPQAVELVEEYPEDMVDAMCREMSVRRANAHEGVLTWRGLSAMVRLSSVKTATRTFTYSEKMELESEIEGTELRNADRLKTALRPDYLAFA